MFRSVLMTLASVILAAATPSAAATAAPQPAFPYGVSWYPELWPETT